MKFWCLRRHTDTGELALLGLGGLLDLPIIKLALASAHLQHFLKPLLAGIYSSCHRILKPQGS